MRAEAATTDWTQRAVRAAGALLAALTLLGVLAAAGAEAKTRFQIDGRGFGHGVGMSQWGAYGFALEGRSAKRIVEHYYTGAELQKVSTKREVRVLLSVRDGEVSFTNAKGACGKRLKPAKVYRAVLRRGKVQLRRSGGGKRLRRCGKELIATGKGPIEIGGEGTFRGRLVARATGEGLYAINKVELDDYIKGVIPNESPASWPAAALEAQAIAARSYALATDKDGDGFDHYDDTRSQVYVGKATEQRSTNRAARRTAGQVLRYGGEVIPAFFFSSSGGRTENVEFGFLGGSPRPYLKSVRDPFDDAPGNSKHSWRLTYGRGEMESRLGGLVRGKLRRIKVTRTGVSPRVVTAKVIGSGGRTTASGPELRTKLGLFSHWFEVKRKR